MMLFWHFAAFYVVNGRWIEGIVTVGYCFIPTAAGVATD